jgi:quercetin dioxygenase-like cupin family protein
MRMITAVLSLVGVLSWAAGTPRPALQFNPEDVKWTAAKPPLPEGARVALLEGDPKAAGIFTMRVELPAGAKVMPHTHPKDERVTVLSGSVNVGAGAKFDPAKTRVVREGGFYVIAAGSPHFVSTNTGAVLQVTGIGPWELKLLK